MQKQPFPVEGEVKGLRIGGGGGLKHFRTGGVTDLWERGGGTFAGGWVSTLLRAMVNVTI